MSSPYCSAESCCCFQAVYCPSPTVNLWTRPSSKTLCLYLQNWEALDKFGDNMRAQAPVLNSQKINVFIFTFELDTVENIPGLNKIITFTWWQQSSFIHFDALISNLYCQQLSKSTLTASVYMRYIRGSEYSVKNPLVCPKKASPETLQTETHYGHFVLGSPQPRTFQKDPNEQC